jgi:hypothetical protein
MGAKASSASDTEPVSVINVDAQNAAEHTEILIVYIAQLFFGRCTHVVGLEHETNRPCKIVISQEVVDALFRYCINPRCGRVMQGLGEGLNRVNK